MASSPVWIPWKPLPVVVARRTGMPMHGRSFRPCRRCVAFHAAVRGRGREGHPRPHVGGHGARWAQSSRRRDRWRSGVLPPPGSQRVLHLRLGGGRKRLRRNDRTLPSNSSAASDPRGTRRRGRHAPSADGFMLIEETLAACPAQSATRLLVETCRQGVADPADLRFPKGLVADLQARIRHEYDPVAGGRAIVDNLLRTQPAIFADWQDLLWLQVVPERFASPLVAANVCPNLESLRSRTHLCVTGCLECVDNGDQSIYGAWPPAST